MANYRKMMDTWKDWRISDKTLKESKESINENTVVFSKDDMEKLHRGYTFLTTSLMPLACAAALRPDRHLSSILSRKERLKFPKPKSFPQYN